MYYNSLQNSNRQNLAIKIAVVDDHILLRDSLINVINGFPNCKVSWKAANGLEMMEQFKVQNPPDIIILDLHMPLMDGYESAKWIVEKFPDTLILVLSMFDSEISLIRLLKIGVRAFLKKDAHASELQYALKVLMEEGYYYPPTISGRLANIFHNPGKTVSTQPLVLSESEITFLKLSSSELTYKEIAKTMFVSPRTIDNYRDQLFGKLNVKCRVGLATYALKSGIVNF